MIVPNSDEIVVPGVLVNLFWIGVLGAVIVEVAVFCGHYDNDKHPEKYRKPGFYVSKLFLAVGGGFLVVIYGANNAPAALQIGASASASALVLALAKRDG
jgi:hypothetical protein